MAAKTGSFNALELESSTVSVSFDGGTTYRDIPGVASVSHTAGERSQTEARAFSGARSVLGSIQASDITFQLVGFLPQHGTSRQLYSAYEDNDLVNFRFTTPERTLHAATSGGVTAAIAVTGIVTFAGANGHPDWGDDAAFYPGCAIVIGGTKHQVETIDVNAQTEAVTVTVDPKPTAAVAAANYSVVNPSLRQSFSGRVRQFGGFEAGSEQGATLTGTLVVQPSGTLPLAVIV